MSDKFQQLDLFNIGRERKVITKPIRIIELFSGIGAQAKALEVLGVPFEHYKTCEWAAPSIKAYNSIHIKDNTDYSKDLTKEQLIDYLQGNISMDYNEPCNVAKKPESWLRETYNNCIATHNLMNIMKVSGKDLEIVDTDKYEYIMTYSFPCQDLSLAGKRQGMETSQADGGTRSGLLWEVERILDELTERPQILLMENVPEVIGSGNVEHFVKWTQKLEKLGYSNHFEVLNGKDYGIPQNRRRCFMISILGDYGYDFPLKVNLRYRLKDFLEEEVNEKYYLSERMLNFFIENTEKQKENGNGFTFAPISSTDEEAIAKTVTTRNGSRMDDNFIADIKKVGNYGNGHHAKDVFDSEGSAPTITTGNHGLGIAIIEKAHYTEKSLERIKKNIVEDDNAPCITANAMQSVNHQNCVLVVEKKPNYGRAALNETIENQELENGDFIDAYNRTIKKDIAGSITTRVNEANNTFVAVKDSKVDRIGGLFDKENQTHQAGSIYNANGLSPCLDTATGGHRQPLITEEEQANIRIRKLTPVECMKLMGFERKDEQAMKKVGLSDSAIYHCAGDSIVVTCLIGLFGQLLPISEEDLLKKINEYVTILKEE